MNQQLTFRPAQSSDFEAVLDLSTQLAHHVEEPTPPFTPERFETFFLAPHAPMHLLLALREGKVVGLLSWIVDIELHSAATRVYISDLAIDRDSRGHGVGTALFQQVELWARERNISKLIWEVWRENHTALAFYTKLGTKLESESLLYSLKLDADQP